VGVSAHKNGKTTTKVNGSSPPKYDSDDISPRRTRRGGAESVDQLLAYISCMWASVYSRHEVINTKTGAGAARRWLSFASSTEDSRNLLRQRIVLRPLTNPPQLSSEKRRMPRESVTAKQETEGIGEREK